MTERLSTLLARLSEALNEDHPCEETVTCDIARAREEGLTLWAAHLLEGATECPATERALGRIRASMPPARFERKLEAQREAMCALPHWQCPACNAILWEDPTESWRWAEGALDCGQCLARGPIEGALAVPTQGPGGRRAVLLPEGWPRRRYVPQAGM